MRRLLHVLVLVGLLAAGSLLPVLPVESKLSAPNLALCRDLGFSTEEDFVTRGPMPPDGNTLISDGDLLGPNCAVCARNRDLLQIFQVSLDLGLDAVDILDVENYVVAFSTELDSPNVGQFTAGDLLVTNGAVIPNAALLNGFKIPLYDLGLDGLHFVGDLRSIRAFLVEAAKISRRQWLENRDMLIGMLTQYEIDIWFSTEGTAPLVTAPAFLDGDVLSARSRTVVASNATLLPSSVPAGIPQRGVDFGLDALAADRAGNARTIQFSTEILFGGELAFTDGDILQYGNGVVSSNQDLVKCFEPAADFVGLDALHVTIAPPKSPELTAGDSPGGETWPTLAGGSAASSRYAATLAPMSACTDLAFSTEEDFVTQGPVPADGNPIISDGDLLGKNCSVCARNRELLAIFQITPDLGLDAVDVLAPDIPLVAFSTELDSPNAGQFTAGDLLATNGTVIPNAALLAAFSPAPASDLGLDGLQFVGNLDAIVGFLDAAKSIGREGFVKQPGMLAAMLQQSNVDIWFSTEGSLIRAGAPGFLDGDLLSARTGTVVVSQSALLPLSVPAGIPNRGVDFGLDAVATDRRGNTELLRFSTEILFNGTPPFTDGDILRLGDGVEKTNADLVSCFEPKALFLGLDALSMPSLGVQPTPTPTPTPTWTEIVRPTFTPTLTPWPTRTPSPTPTHTEIVRPTFTPTATVTRPPPVDFPKHDKPYAEEEITIVPYPVQPGIATKICVTIVNPAGVPQTVLISFEMANFGIGLGFMPIPAAGNPRLVTVPANSSMQYCIVWVPGANDAGHRCIQVTLTQEGYEPRHSQKNLDIVEPLRPGRTDQLVLPVRNPLQQVVDIEIRVESHCSGWLVSAEPNALPQMAPGEVRNVTLNVTPPADAVLGSGCWIDVEAWAVLPTGAQQLIGGIRKVDYPPVQPHDPNDPPFAQREIVVDPYPMVVGKRTTVCAWLYNPTGQDQVVTVEFSMADFGIGVPFTPIVHPDNPQVVTIPAHGSTKACIWFVPTHVGHVCFQIKISKPGYRDVYSQKNIDVIEPLWQGQGDTLIFPVGNPLTYTTDIEIEVVNNCPGWDVSAEPELLHDVPPGEVRNVSLHVMPQPAATLGTECTVDVIAWAGNQMIGGIRKIDRPPVPHTPEDPPFAEREIQVFPFPLQTGVLTNICAVLENKSDQPQTVKVEFSMADFTIGQPFTPIAVAGNPRLVTIPPHSIIRACIQWTPLTPGHKCFQIRISQQGYRDIISQKNLDVGENLRRGERDELIFTVGNPTSQTADIQLVVSTNCGGWQVSVEPAILEDVPPGGVRDARLVVIPPTSGEPLGSGCFIDVEAYINGELIGGIRKLDLPPVKPPLDQKPYAERELTIQPDPPVVGQPAQVCVDLYNSTAADAMVDITLYVADFGIGMPWQPVGTISDVLIPAYGTVHRCLTWTPSPGSASRCLQVRIQQDNYQDIVSQRNIKVVYLPGTVQLPIVYQFCVGNPKPQPITIHLDVTALGLPADWVAELAWTEATLAPNEVRCNVLTITLASEMATTLELAPGTLPGDSHLVAVEAWADDELLGGVQFEFEPVQPKLYLPVVLKRSS